MAFQHDPDDEVRRFIEKRHRQRVEEEGERKQEAEWAASERRAIQMRREANKAEWAAYHGRMADYHYARAEHHLKERRRIEKMPVVVMPSRSGRYTDGDGKESA
jgi:hypothetical protein